MNRRRRASTIARQFDGSGGIDSSHRCVRLAQSTPRLTS